MRCQFCKDTMSSHKENAPAEIFVHHSFEIDDKTFCIVVDCEKNHGVGKCLRVSADNNTTIGEGKWN